MSERWPAEEIPDADLLYLRVHRQWIKNGRIAPGFFQNRPSEMSGAMMIRCCRTIGRIPMWLA